MEYLERLMEEFSDTPRNIILKADMIRRGVKETETLLDAGRKF